MGEKNGSLHEIIVSDFFGETKLEFSPEHQDGIKKNNRKNIFLINNSNQLIRGDSSLFHVPNSLMVTS